MRPLQMLLAVVFVHSAMVVNTVHINIFLSIAVTSLPVSISSQVSNGCFEQRARML